MGLHEKKMLKYGTEFWMARYGIENCFSLLMILQTANDGKLYCTKKQELKKTDWIWN